MNNLVDLFHTARIKIFELLIFEQQLSDNPGYTCNNSQMEFYPNMLSKRIQGATNNYFR